MTYDPWVISLTNQVLKASVIFIIHYRYYNLSSTLPSSESAASGQRRHSVGTFLGKDRNTCSGRRPTQTVEVLVEPSSMAPPIPTDTVDGIICIDDRRGRSSGCRSRRRRHRSSSSKGELIVFYLFYITHLGRMILPRINFVFKEIDKFIHVNSARQRNRRE